MTAPSKLHPRVVAALAVLMSCGPVSRRDLGAMPQRHITYDDLCHLQDYFNQRAASHAGSFRVESEEQTETTREERDDHGAMRPVIVGDGTYIIADHTDRVRLSRLLHDEYDRMPTPLHITRAEADVRLHVVWWQSGAIRRLRPDATIELTVNAETHTLPFNPCVGEFLFGAEAYAMRRNVLDAESARAHGEIPTQYLPDAGRTEAGVADAGVADAAGDALPHADVPAADGGTWRAP